MKPFEEFPFEIELARLSDGLASAISYLQLMPKTPATMLKIHELQGVLNNSHRPLPGLDSLEWRAQRFLPTGQPLELVAEFVNRNVVFTAPRYDFDGQLSAISFDVAGQSLDSLIGLLVNARRLGQ